MTVGPITALRHGFVHYVDFGARSSRSEFWWFALWYALLGVLASVLDVTIGVRTITILGDPNDIAAGVIPPRVVPGYIYDLLVTLIFFVPLLTLTWRRLRDAGFKGALSLLYFIPWLLSEITGVYYLAVAGTARTGVLSLGLSFVALLCALTLLTLLLSPSSERYANSPTTYPRSKQTAPSSKVG